MALYEKIQNHPLEFPIEVNMSAGLRRLLRAMMEKNPAKRTTLDQVPGREVCTCAAVVVLVGVYSCMELRTLDAIFRVSRQSRRATFQ